MALRPGFIEELSAAARGTIALVIGDRKAPGYFDFSRRGLYGAAIAFLVTVLIQTYAQIAFGFAEGAGLLTREVASEAILLVTVLGSTAIFLRQIKRSDALVPYLVAFGWASSFLGTVLALGTTIDVLLIGVLIVNLVIVINIARLIMTLPPLQIVILLVAQAVGGMVGLLLIGVLVPVPPEVAAEVAAALGQ